MFKLKQLYIAIFKKLQEYTSDPNSCENPPLVELRLDIEQIIQIACKDLGVPYDQEPITDQPKPQSAEDITDAFWKGDDDE